MRRPFLLAFCMRAAVVLSAHATAAEPWVDVPLPDGDMQAEDTGPWRAYRRATLSKVTDPKLGRRVLRVAVHDGRFGGMRLEATPRGGFGNRVRLELRYRVVSGQPVTIYTGPNNWNQAAAMLTNREWETVTVEVGLLTDFHLVLHVVQPGPEGMFELAALRISARAAGQAVRERLGPVDVAVHASSPSDPAVAFQLKGQPPPKLAYSAEESAILVDMAQQAAPGAASMNQALGYMPAGTRLKLICRCRAAQGVASVVGIRLGGKAVSQVDLAPGPWAPIAVDAILPADGRPEWFVSSAPAEASRALIADAHIWVTLPDPTGPGVVALPAERRGITFGAGDAKTIFIHPPWPGIPRIKCHLEYTSRWNYRFPTSHEAELSDAKDALTLKWRFTDDPIQYAVRMEADRPNAVLVEAKLTNGSAEPVEAFRPGFCLQIMGAFAPKLFAYTIIPRNKEPFAFFYGRPFEERPALWPGIGWARCHNAHASVYRDRVRQGDRFKPDRKLLHETGDFPLLARRVPGRDAWIAWIWPNVRDYFGNTQTPCMHMDPMLEPIPAGRTGRVFGRMMFFEGSWEQLYAAAERERNALQARGRGK